MAALKSVLRDHGVVHVYDVYDSTYQYFIFSGGGGIYYNKFLMPGRYQYVYVRACPARTWLW